MIVQFCYQFPIGEICIQEKNKEIIGIHMENGADKKERGFLQIKKEETPLIRQAYQQLVEYFHKQRKDFSFPIQPSGTEFQKKVWKALCTIPYGETCSYRDIAEKIGNPNACRAVGGANHKNPIMIVIPCHRVIGVDGSLTGYGGGLSVKEYLLQLEREA